jgi:hypothetical protein
MGSFSCLFLSLYMDSIQGTVDVSGGVAFVSMFSLASIFLCITGSVPEASALVIASGACQSCRLVFLFWPQIVDTTASTFNWSLTMYFGIGFVAMSWWVFSARKTYKGPEVDTGE